MHPHFKKRAEEMIAKQPRDMTNEADVADLRFLLETAMKDNARLMEGFPVTNEMDCLTLADLNLLVAEIHDADLRQLLERKVGRFLAKKTNTTVMGQ